MAEYWDVYDKNRIFQNMTIRRGAAFADGQYYVCCEIWFKNSKGEMLVTQRHPNKKAGGLWEFIGGGVLSGETTVQAAIREVKEEIGIELSVNELLFLHELKQKNYFMDIYLVNKDINPEDFVLDKNETVNAKWISKKELHTMIENQEMVRSVALRYNMLESKL